MLFSRGKNDIQNIDIEGVLNALNGEIIVVRGADCSILAMNAAARKRITEEGLGDTGCKKGYCSLFGDLCRRCALNQDESAENSLIADCAGGGTYNIFSKKITYIDGKEATVMQFFDITEERHTKEKLQSLAYTDQLTGIPNRLSFRESFEKIHPKIDNNSLCGAVAIFDLDNFKAVNDTYGHNTGDIMLRRLAEHFQADPAFDGHIYRLGGDEFALLFYDDASAFQSQKEIDDHYMLILQGALKSYTIPNIEIACTLSIGGATFSRHGTAVSELMRKADIALYEAKAAGRNRIVMFEDKYEKAKKFKDIFIGVQPISTASKAGFGYELIDQSDAGEDDDGVNLGEINRTIDALGVGDISSDSRYFIPFNQQLLSPAVMQNLPRNMFIIQLPAPKTAADIEKIKHLKTAGYKICIKGITAQSAPKNLNTYANFARFDPDDKNKSLQSGVIKNSPGVSFIAEKIDNLAAFENAKKAGFHLFQGYFFNESRPTVKSSKEIDPLRVNYARLLQLTSAEGYVDFKEISTIIASDVALSYKLLRLLNSAAVGLKNVASISVAVAYLGEESLKKWIGLLALRGIANDKPLELVRISLVRARMGELLAPNLRLRRDPKKIFLLGMLSLLHAALDKTKEEVLEEMPVAEDIAQSLLTRNGPYSDLLTFFEDYEYGNWEEVSRFSEENGLDSSFVTDCYIASIKWFNDLAQ